MIRTLLFALALTACGHASNDEKTPAPNARVEDLRGLYGTYLGEAAELRNSPSGWLVPDDCDGFLWTGEYAAVTGAEATNFGAAEYPDEPGRFARRPLTNPCDPYGDRGSSWSRDMGLGLVAYALRMGNLPILTRHEGYGQAHQWQMGEPLGDGRAVYTPSMIGLVYQAIFALGGPDNLNRRWPDIYVAGLTDYQAHIQVLSIWARAELAERIAAKGPEKNPGSDPAPITDTGDKVAPADLALLGITDTQLARLQEHAAREPKNPFFQAELGVFTGDMTAAIDVLLDPEMPMGSYVRCSEFRRCQLAEWLFAADIVLRRYPK